MVSLADNVVASPWHGRVSNAAGIGEVTESVILQTLHASAPDHRWVLAIVGHALACIAGATEWRSAELERFIAPTADEQLPLLHLFRRLQQVDGASGVSVMPWLSTQPGETCIGVRVISADNVERDVLIQSTPAPLS